MDVTNADGRRSAGIVESQNGQLPFFLSNDNGRVSGE